MLGLMDHMQRTRATNSPKSKASTADRNIRQCKPFRDIKYVVHASRCGDLPSSAGKISRRDP